MKALATRKNCFGYILLCSLSCLLAITTHAIAGEPETQNLIVGPLPKVIGGDEFEVLRVAYNDFIKELQKEVRNQGDPSQIEDYIFVLEEGDDHATFRVGIGLRPVHGTFFFGGGVSYVITKSTHQIVDKRLNM